MGFINPKTHFVCSACTYCTKNANLILNTISDRYNTLQIILVHDRLNINIKIVATYKSPDS